MFKAAILVSDGVQDQEFFYPFYRLQELDCHLDVILSVYKNNKQPKSKYGVPLPYDLVSTAFFEYLDMYDLIVIPGGWQCPEILRMDEHILALVEKHFLEGKIISTICHGIQVLISALFNHNVNLLVTGYKGIMHDIINAGFSYADKSVVKDNNIISAQHYRDNPEWMKITLEQFQCQNK